nr:hypothetical protein GCM10025732_49460 [Glycomyces mayteni]
MTLKESDAPGSTPGPSEARRTRASQRRLVWWAFKKHRLALVSAWLLAAMLVVIALCEFMAPFTDRHRDSEYTTAPPQVLKLWDTDGPDGFRFGLHVDGYTSEQDPRSLRITYEPNPDDRVDVGLFVKGEEYELFGLIPMDRHLIGPEDVDDPMYLFGTTTDGQDLLSQLVYATRVSASVGIIGVLLAFLLGIVLGGVSGYFGGWIDNVVQRVIELIMSVPSIPCGSASPPRSRPRWARWAGTSSSRRSSRSSRGPAWREKCAAGSSRCARRSS